MQHKNHYFYNIIRKTCIQFIDFFNDVTVARYNDNDVITKYVKVPVKFAPKTKQWYWSELRAHKDRRDQIFPMISIDLDNVEYASDRQVNKNIKIPFLNDGNKTQTYFNPVPYDFTFNVQIASEYINDILQIVEQILPFFTPENYIRITVPELDITGLNPTDDGADKLELRVVYDGSQSDMPVELDEAGYRILLWTHTFKVQGYLFSPTQEVGTINKVIQSYYTTDFSWEHRQEDTNNEYFENGLASVQGISYSTDIPVSGTHVDDTVRSLWKYEHVPREYNATLYTIPLQGKMLFPLTIEIKSNTPIREIWYTLIEMDNTYIIDINEQYITSNGDFVILSGNEISHQLTKYIKPLDLPLNNGGYIVKYIGVCNNGSTTPIFTSIFYPSNIYG